MAPSLTGAMLCKSSGSNPSCVAATLGSVSSRMEKELHSQLKALNLFLFVGTLASIKGPMVALGKITGMTLTRGNTYPTFRREGNYIFIVLYFYLGADA